MLNTYISSSNIHRVGWQRGTLYIEFNSGTIYAYDHVPFAQYLLLAGADSVGQHFHKYIKTEYQYVKLDYDPFAEVGVNQKVQHLGFHELPRKAA